MNYKGKRLREYQNYKYYIVTKSYKHILNSSYGNLIDKYLNEFKNDAKDWFNKIKDEHNSFLRKYYDFYKSFFTKENLEKAEWSDIQKIGNNINAFQRNALARTRAFGKPNHSIEHYRKSFLHLIDENYSLEQRIIDFTENPDYKINLLSNSSWSEIIGFLFAENYVLYNARDKFALELLNINPGFEKGDKFASEYFKFNKAIGEVIEKYKKIVGPHTDLPINLEVDQFFSYLYSKYSKNNLEELREELLQYGESLGAKRVIVDNNYTKLEIFDGNRKRSAVEINNIRKNNFKIYVSNKYLDNELKKFVETKRTTTHNAEFTIYSEDKMEIAKAIVKSAVVYNRSYAVSAKSF